MFDALTYAETNIGHLLSESGEWKSKKIDYSPPIVDRLYRDFDYNGAVHRLYLHRIYPCERAFFHPHPWPSALRVLGAPGSVYEMGVSYSSNNRHDPPPIACTIRLMGGALYEMVDRNAWHYVKIIGEPSISVMVSGPVWNRDAPRTENREFRELTEDEKTPILNRVEVFYRALHVNQARQARKGCPIPKHANDCNCDGAGGDR